MDSPMALWLSFFSACFNRSISLISLIDSFDPQKDNVPYLQRCQFDRRPLIGIERNQ